VYFHENESFNRLGLMEDVQQQKQTLAELRESEARFRSIFEKSSAGIALVSLDGHPLLVNQAILKMTGFSEQELLAMTGLGTGH
jgi:PAS domain-containing protein